MITPIDSHTFASLISASLAKGDAPPLEVISGSMTPLLAIGDQVIIENCPASQLQVGDIIVVRAPDMLVTHRFCAMYEDDEDVWLILRGDRRMGYDAPVRINEYIGRIAARQRGERTLSLKTGKGRWLSRHYGRIAHLEAWLFRANADQACHAASKTDLLIGQTWHNHWHTRQIIHAVRLPLFLWGVLLGRLIY